MAFPCEWADPGRATFCLDMAKPCKAARIWLKQNIMLITNNSHHARLALPCFCAMANQATLSEASIVMSVPRL